MSGKFITVEGTEGAGKSTCMSLIQEIIEAESIALCITREPGGTPLGEDLREMLLSHKHTGMQDDTELLMMFSARAEHIGNKIKPALDSGQWVLSDRFTDATYAYQGGGRSISTERIKTLEDWVQKGLKPDLTILMNVDVEIGLERASKRSTPDRFEKEKIAFFTRVQNRYLEIAEAEPDRFIIIDANQELENVRSDIKHAITRFLHA